MRASGLSQRVCLAKAGASTRSASIGSTPRKGWRSAVAARGAIAARSPASDPSLRRSPMSTGRWLSCRMLCRMDGRCES